MNHSSEVIVYTKLDGSIRVFGLAQEYYDRKIAEGHTHEEVIAMATAKGGYIQPGQVKMLAEVAKISIEEAQVICDMENAIRDPIVMPHGNVPQDLLFHGAWKLNQAKTAVEVDLPKARDIAHEVRRAHRDKLMEPLDRLATSPQASVKNKAMADKQLILDSDAPVQSALDAAQTPESMRAILEAYGAIPSA